jgi:hypothetical protein
MAEMGDKIGVRSQGTGMRQAFCRPIKAAAGRESRVANNQQKQCDK